MRLRLFFFLPRSKDELPPSSPLPLEVGPRNTARDLGERCKLPSGAWDEALVHIGIKKCSFGGSSFC